ncbi:MAG: hypothetical protein K9L62_13530 [Vallitaleaceae bacterium]|nr:hypothetical protein [Vallitaleaceae bacterium]
MSNYHFTVIKDCVILHKTNVKISDWKKYHIVYELCGRLELSSEPSIGVRYGTRKV